MLGGTAESYEPTLYNSTVYDNYLFGRLMNYGYPVMGLASWCSSHISDTDARTVLNSAIGILYQNLTDYTNHNWTSFDGISGGSLYYGEFNPIQSITT
ncbi:hypothetical protein D3C81_1671130 [compost metagenome]